MSNLIFNFFEPEFFDGFPMDDIFNPKFKSNWNHLMKVVEGLEKKFPEINIEMNKNSCFIYYHSLSENYVFCDTIYGDTRIEATYNAIVDFIRWYNLK